MILRDLPDVEASLNDMKPVLPVVWRAFDKGATQARATIDSLHEICGASLNGIQPNGSGPSTSYDPHFFAHAARYTAKLFLTERGLQVDIELDHLANSGLRLRYDGRVVRIRKSTRTGGIPSAGDSKPMRELYQLILGEEFRCAGSELYILWHATPFGVFTGLSLVCALPSTRSNDVILGCVDLPNPVETDTFVGVAQGDVDSVGDLSDLDYGDLPIEPLTSEDEDSMGQDDAEQAG